MPQSKWWTKRVAKAFGDNTGYGVVQRHSRAGPVNHEFVTWLMLNMHSQVMLVYKIPVELAELRVLKMQQP